MRKLAIAALAAAGLASVAFVAPASAQSACYWTGYNWSCPQTYYSPGYYGYPAGSYYPNYGYKPAWMPSYPGPKPSTGAGH